MSHSTPDDGAMYKLQKHTFFCYIFVHMATWAENFHDICSEASSMHIGNTYKMLNPNDGCVHNQLLGQ
jgi:hypothetical protein